MNILNVLQIFPYIQGILKYMKTILADLGKTYLKVYIYKYSANNLENKYYILP